MFLALLELWERFGRIPAFPVVAGCLAAIVLFWVLPDGPVVAVAATAMLAALILHCLARERGGWDVFSAAALPGCTGQLLATLAGVDPAWGLLLLPLSLSLARDVDRGRRAPAAASE